VVDPVKHDNIFTRCVVVSWPNAAKPINLWFHVKVEMMIGVGWYEGMTPYGFKYWSVYTSFGPLGFSVSRNK